MKVTWIDPSSFAIGGATGFAEVDDRKAPVAEGHPPVGRPPDTRVVGAPVPHAVPHRGDAGQVHGLAAPGEYADDPAHLLRMMPDLPLR